MQLGTRYQLFLEYHIPVKGSIQRPILFKLACSLALFVLLITSIPWAVAQRAAHSPSYRAIPRFNQPIDTFAFAQSAHPFGARRPPRASLPFPLLDDFFDAADLYSTGYPVASQPPVIVLQAARAASLTSDSLGQPKARRGLSSSQPLTIELQNGRYVRVSSSAANGEVLPAYNRAQTGKVNPEKLTHPKSNATSSVQDLPPAVLVFRDGHTEEVHDYSIADGILYARGDYYTDGYWNKKIELSSLNVAETLQANTEHGVRFVLPSSPNEVITRP